MNERDVERRLRRLENRNRRLVVLTALLITTQALMLGMSALGQDSRSVKAKRVETEELVVTRPGASRKVQIDDLGLRVSDETTTSVAHSLLNAGGLRVYAAEKRKAPASSIGPIPIRPVSWKQTLFSSDGLTVTGFEKNKAHWRYLFLRQGGIAMAAAGGSAKEQLRVVIGEPELMRLEPKTVWTPPKIEPGDLASAYRSVVRLYDEAGKLTFSAPKE